MHTIIHGDCLEELKKLKDDSVDVVMTDPPYGLSNTKPQQVADVLATTNLLKPLIVQSRECVVE